MDRLTCTSFVLLTLLTFLRSALSKECYSCSSSHYSADNDDEQTKACPSGDSSYSNLPCCRDPFGKNMTMKAEKESRCSLCLKVKYTWDKRDPQKIYFVKRICYNENLPQSGGGGNVDGLQRVISEVLSLGENVQKASNVESQQEDKEEQREIMTAVLNEECRVRELESPQGEVKMEVCGCKGDFCNHQAPGATPTSGAVMSILMLAAVAYNLATL